MLQSARDVSSRSSTARRWTSASEALVTLAPFSGLSTAQLREIDKFGRLRRYRYCETIVRVGEAPEFVGLVAHGYLRVKKTMRDGRQQIVALLSDGDLFRRDVGAGHDFEIEAASEAVVVALQPHAFETYLERIPDFERLIMLNILDELDRARELLVILASPKVMSRLAGLLLVFSRRYARADWLLQGEHCGSTLRIPISRLDQAQLLGTSPESISRAYHKLADAGHILLHAPDVIEIVDPRGLLEESGEEAELALW